MYSSVLFIPFSKLYIFFNNSYVYALASLISRCFICMFYKNAVFDTNIKSLLRHISAEKGLK